MEEGNHSAGGFSCGSAVSPGARAPAAMTSTAGQAIGSLQALAASLRGLSVPDRLPPAARLSLIAQLDDDARETLVRVLDNPADLPSRGLAGWPRLADEACGVFGSLMETYALLLQHEGVPRDVLEPGCVRLAAAAAQRVKWELLSCGPRHPDLWPLLGAVRRSEWATPAVATEYLRAVAYSACGIDQVTPAAVSEVDRLIDLVLPHLELQSAPGADAPSVAVPPDGLPPRRLLGSEQPAAGTLYFTPGPAARILTGLSAQLSQGVVPAGFGGRRGGAPLLQALQTLLRHWSGAPPMRRYRRHLLNGRLAVVRGFEELKELVQGGQPPTDAEWLMHDASRGGVGAIVPARADDTVQMGDLVGLRSTEGDAWHLGIVRRKRAAGDDRLVGIETVSQCPEIVSVDDGRAASDALLCDPLLKGEAVRILISPDALMSGVPLFVTANGTIQKLKPLDASTGGRDFELRVYQVL